MRYYKNARGVRPTGRDRPSLFILRRAQAQDEIAAVDIGRTLAGPSLLPARAYLHGHRPNIRIETTHLAKHARNPIRSATQRASRQCQRAHYSRRRPRSWTGAQVRSRKVNIFFIGTTRRKQYPVFVATSFATTASRVRWSG